MSLTSSYKIPEWLDPLRLDVEKARKEEILRIIRDRLNPPTYSTLEALILECGAHFTGVCMEKGIFEIPTKEYVEDLAAFIHFLEPRSSVLEICAGDGSLAHLLHDQGVKIVPTDDGSWNIPLLAPVLKLSYQEALRNFQPAVVLCSWMPFQYDFTPVIRATGIPHYILIGESEGGCCAADNTWNKDLLEKDGYTFEELKFRHPQICRTDYSWGDDIATHSRTYHFFLKKGV